MSTNLEPTLNSVIHNPHRDLRLSSQTIGTDRSVNDMSNQVRDDRYYHSVTIGSTPSVPYLLPRRDMHIHTLTVGDND